MRVVKANIKEETYKAGKGFCSAAESAGRKAVKQFFDRIEFDDEEEDDELDILANLGVYFLKGVTQALMDYYPVDAYQGDAYKEIMDLTDKDMIKESKRIRK